MNRVNVRVGSRPTKLPMSITSPIIPQLPTCERTSIGAALCQEPKYEGYGPGGQEYGIEILLTAHAARPPTIIRIGRTR